jgi:chemotaxis signal transduction protein
MPASQVTHAPRQRLAQASIGAVHLGIPVEAVVQAIALPDTPSFLPRRQGALRGVVDHLGSLVPVVDLARWVDLGQSAPSIDARILVLRDGGRTIGLQVDAVGGLVDIEAHHFTRLHHDDNPEDVFQTAVRSPDDGRVLSLLEVGRLADLAAAWSQVERGDDAAGAASPAASIPATDTRTWALLQTGAGRLAVAPGDLAEVIPMPPLERFGGAIDNAYCVWRGRHLPVLAAGTLIGADADGGDDGLLAVIEHGGLALGVPVRAALHMAAIAGRGLPSVDGVTATVFDADGLAIHLLDTTRLFARFPEAALSKPDAGMAAAAGHRLDKRAGNAMAYLVFEADGLGATPVAAVEQILPLAAPAGASMDWRGTAISLVDLRGAVSSGSASSAGNVLVVRGAGRHVGYLVTRVHSLIPPGSGQLYRMGAAGGEGLEFITTGEGVEQASYRILDLAGRTEGLVPTH